MFFWFLIYNNTITDNENFEKLFKKGLDVFNTIHTKFSIHEYYDFSFEDHILNEFLAL